MNVIDVVIILLILLGGVIGFKRGVLKQLVSTIGTLIAFYLAFVLKDPLASWLSSFLPFFEFTGTFAGVTVLNVILYQAIAFFIMLILFLSLLGILVNVTGIIEKVLKFTIVLGIPSKILGFIVGIIEGYIIIFVALYFVNQPAINIGIVQESQLKPIILEKTPFLSGAIDKMNKAVTDIYSLKDKFEDKKDANQFNLETLDVLLKYEVIKPDYIQKLVDQNKLKNVVGIDSILNRYR